MVCVLEKRWKSKRRMHDSELHGYRLKCSVVRYTIQAIHEAFVSMGGDPHDGSKLGWSSICAKLQSMVERISDEELAHCLEVNTRQKTSRYSSGWVIVTAVTRTTGGV